MLTHETHESVTVLGYGPWDETNERMGEFVRVKVSDEERTRRYTLDRSLNGDRPADGSVARLVLQTRMAPKARQSRDGSLFTVYVEKSRVVGFLDVQAPAKAAA